MDRINPFDNLHFKQGLGQTEQISSPKANEKAVPEQSESQGINSIPKSDEDDFVDASALIDDTGDFNTSNFDFENNDKTNEVNSTESKDDNKQNQNESNEEELKEQVNEFVNELLEKRNQ